LRSWHPAAIHSSPALQRNKKGEEGRGGADSQNYDTPQVFCAAEEKENTWWKKKSLTFRTDNHLCMRGA
jgi:hypothetical protein